jgi:hypothetical protein
MPERGALLGLAVHPPQHRVDVDEREHVGLAEQQRHPPGQVDQQPRRGRLQLLDVPERERAQERPERGRRDTSPNSTFTPP